jgi:hypothetical protein
MIIFLEVIKMHETYIIDFIRIGSDRIESHYDFRCDAVDGYTKRFRRNGQWGCMAMDAISAEVERMKATEAYSKIMVLKWGLGEHNNKTTVLEWEMDAEKLQDRNADFEAYEKRIAELKAQMKVLRAEMRKLDKSFDRVKN